MSLKDVLQSHQPPEEFDLSHEEMVKFFWKYKGLLKNQERANAFWGATNDNLKSAYERLDEKDRELEKAYNTIQEDLEVASQIQSALLPVVSHELAADLEIAAFHSQLAEVGGDYFDYFKMKDDHQAIGVFDISGHGVSAALVMTYLKAQFMGLMDTTSSPKAIVDAVNRSSYDFLKSVKKYATVNFVVFLEDRIRYACGGGFGLLVHGDEEHHFHKRDHFLGLRNRPFREHELPFVEGDLLALYTDGVPEGQNAAREDYTVRRLNELIIANRDKPVEVIVDLCMEDYRSFRNADTDDITLLVMRRKKKT